MEMCNDDVMGKGNDDVMGMVNVVHKLVLLLHKFRMCVALYGIEMQG